jgi:hypothetical protein
MGKKRTLFGSEGSRVASPSSYNPLDSEMIAFSSAHPLFPMLKHDTCTAKQSINFPWGDEELDISTILKG